MLLLFFPFLLLLLTPGLFPPVPVVPLPPFSIVTLGVVKEGVRFGPTTTVVDVDVVVAVVGAFCLLDVDDDTIAGPIDKSSSDMLRDHSAASSPPPCRGVVVILLPLPPAPFPPLGGGGGGC